MTPEKYSHVETEDRNSVFVSIEAVGDTTIRPIRSEILRQVRPNRPAPKKDADNGEGKQG